MCDRGLGGGASTSVPETVQWLVLSPLSSWSLVIMCATLCVHFVTATLCRSIKVRTVVYNRDSTLSRHITACVNKTTGHYVTPFWALSPMFHTLLAPFLLGTSCSNFRRDYLLLNDRGVIAMDWYCQAANASLSSSSPNNGGAINDRKISRSATIRKNKYIMVVVPDINSDSFSVTHVGDEASVRNISVVVFNRRGHGGSVLTTPKLQPYGDSTDLRQLVKYVKGRYPRHDLVALGFGAGADLLISYLGDYGSSSYFRATVAISPLYDPQANLFDRPVLGIDRPLHLLQLLKEKWLLLRHSASLQKTIDVYDALKSPNFKDLYRNCYYKFSDCANDEQFWEKNSPLRDVDDISSPLLCISSLDDPFCEPEAIPYDLFSLYPNMCLVTADVGGHCGFIEASSVSSNGGPRWASWAVSLALDYVQSVVSFSSE